MFFWAPGREQAVDRLLAYFGGVAAKLLQPAEEILRCPSIWPSLPGKKYSISLWDWDTYWTAGGADLASKENGDLIVCSSRSAMSLHSRAAIRKDR